MVFSRRRLRSGAIESGFESKLRPFALAMDPEQKAQLESWVRARATPQKIVLRSRICLLAHEGHGNRQIARQLSTSRPTVLLWRDRFAASGVAGLEHEPPRKASSQRLEDTLILVRL